MRISHYSWYHLKKVVCQWDKLVLLADFCYLLQAKKHGFRFLAFFAEFHYLKKGKTLEKRVHSLIL